ncbi:MAG: 16S rRNA (guanine(527)-N(7))-methyltransferase RsmG, partial [Sulfurovaceae bacterium]|nr:16S rRNA (guanine(527)-N(7))-methyltransferase RsmG [Sulfurovaceae bacterium]
DVGTGAGFPGLILAIAYPNARVVLCEPRNKRASFLKFVAMELELNNINVVKKRVEEYKDKPFELISSRAVTNTKMLLDLTHHLQNSNTKYLFYKGEQIFNELEIIDRTIDYDIITQGKRNYLYIKKVQNDT